MANGNQVLDLRHLTAGFGQLTAHMGGVFSEAASVCLEHLGHVPGATIAILGSFATNRNLLWSPPTDEVRRTHADLQDATEYGACGIALLLVADLTGLVFFERSMKGTGIDFWLGEDGDSLFQNKARLEATGILNGTADSINSRLRIKRKQVQQSGGKGLPAYIVVVEFSKPQAQVEIR